MRIRIMIFSLIFSEKILAAFIHRDGATQHQIRMNRLSRQSNWLRYRDMHMLLLRKSEIFFRITEKARFKNGWRKGQNGSKKNFSKIFGGRKKNISIFSW